MDEVYSAKAIEATLHAKKSFCKFLSANDSGETKGHQAGILISLSAKELVFPNVELHYFHILEREINVKWQDSFYTVSRFKWYQSKKELRITSFGNGFPFRGDEYTGSLFVLTQLDDDEYEGFFLNTEDEIQNYLDSFGLTPADTNRLINIKDKDGQTKEQLAMERFIAGLTGDFPTTHEMAKAAHRIMEEAFHNGKLVTKDPDKILIDWTKEEYKLFRAIENERYGETITKGFSSFDDFIVLANEVLNRRKSRAGKSLEHHLSAIFDGNEIKYTAQGITEGNKRPDFIFPSIDQYHDLQFAEEKLCFLAAKTTCKDRWRQVLNEANRLRNRHKFICTMQQGISSAQIDEMTYEGVILVVPKAYISSFPKEKHSSIWNIKQLVSYLKELER